MNVDENIAIRINGEERRLVAGMTVDEMVESLGLDPAKVAVERNCEIVPRSLRDEVRVETGDSFEIVHFVGGG